LVRLEGSSWLGGGLLGVSALTGVEVNSALGALAAVSPPPDRKIKRTFFNGFAGASSSDFACSVL
jgi:hypothetical protein